MPVTLYKIWAWGEPVQLSGTFPTRYVGVHGVAKPNIAAHPRAIANELIGAELGRALKLPVPPSFVVQRDEPGEKPEPWFVSLRFLHSGENPPPADADALAKRDPRLAAGIVLFDNWICNADRHDENLAFDEETGQVVLFDHAQALMAGTHGRVRLEALEDKLWIGDCCLPAHLTTIEPFPEWHSRIMGIPEYYVRETVGSGVGVGLTDADANFLVEFLLRRREKLLDLVKAHRSEFRNAPAVLWER